MIEDREKSIILQSMMKSMLENQHINPKDSDDIEDVKATAKELYLWIENECKTKTLLPKKNGGR